MVNRDKWALDLAVKALRDASGENYNHFFEYLDDESPEESASSELEEGAAHEQPSEPAVRAEPTDNDDVRGQACLRVTLQGGSIEVYPRFLTSLATTPCSSSLGLRVPRHGALRPRGRGTRARALQLPEA